MIAVNLLKFLDLGYDINKLHLVGHSLGGQCVGLVARHLKKLSKNKYIIPRVYALDPAGPAFEKNNTLSKVLDWATLKNSDFGMISRDDAKYVQIIHSNAGGFGIRQSRGHADFYPNAGENQAGCDLELNEDVCSHRRAWVFYQESVRNPGTFPAVKCDSFEDFTEGKCKGNEKTLMGLSSDVSTHGNFYLMTHPNPYQSSLGEDGTEFQKLQIVTRDGVQEYENIMVGAIDFNYEGNEFVGNSGNVKYLNFFSPLIFSCILIIIN